MVGKRLELLSLKVAKKIHSLRPKQARTLDEKRWSKKVTMNGRIWKNNPGKSDLIVKNEKEKLVPIDAPKSSQKELRERLGFGVFSQRIKQLTNKIKYRQKRLGLIELTQGIFKKRLNDPNLSQEEKDHVKQKHEKLQDKKEDYLFEINELKNQIENTSIVPYDISTKSKGVSTKSLVDTDDIDTLRFLYKKAFGKTDRDYTKEELKEKLGLDKGDILAKDYFEEAILPGLKEGKSYTAKSPLSEQELSDIKALLKKQHKHPVPPKKKDLSPPKEALHDYSEMFTIEWQRKNLTHGRWEHATANEINVGLGKLIESYFAMKLRAEHAEFKRDKEIKEEFKKLREEFEQMIAKAKMSASSGGGIVYGEEREDELTTEEIKELLTEGKISAKIKEEDRSFVLNRGSVVKELQNLRKTLNLAGDKLIDPSKVSSVKKLKVHTVEETPEFKQMMEARGEKFMVSRKKLDQLYGAYREKAPTTAKRISGQRNPDVIEFLHKKTFGEFKSVGDYFDKQGSLIPGVKAKIISGRWDEAEKVKDQYVEEQRKKAKEDKK